MFSSSKLNSLSNELLIFSIKSLFTSFISSFMYSNNTCISIPFSDFGNPGFIPILKPTFFVLLFLTLFLTSNCLIPFFLSNSFIEL